MHRYSICYIWSVHKIKKNRIWSDSKFTSQNKGHCFDRKKMEGIWCDLIMDEFCFGCTSHCGNAGSGSGSKLPVKIVGSKVCGRKCWLKIFGSKREVKTTEVFFSTQWCWPNIFQPLSLTQKKKLDSSQRFWPNDSVSVRVGGTY
jgi:hypothetical protein